MLVKSSSLITVLEKQLTNPSIVLLLLAVGFLNESHQTITVFLSQLQYAKVGMSLHAMAIAYVITNLVALAGGFSAVLCSRVGAKRMGTGLLSLGALSCLLLGLSSIPVVCVFAVILLRLSFSLMQPLSMELQNRQINGKDRATALSINAVVMESLGIFLNLLYGRIAEIRLDCAMFVGVVLCAAGAVAYRYSFSKP